MNQLYLNIQKNFTTYVQADILYPRTRIPKTKQCYRWIFIEIDQLFSN